MVNRQPPHRVKPLIYNDFQQKCDSLIHTTITHISNFIFGHHDLRNTIQEPRLHSARIILDFTTDPINTNQYSGNHPPTKILDKRTTWITSQMTQFKPATIANLHLWPPIKIAYAQPTNLDPLSIESNIEQTWQPKNDPDPRPTSKSQHIILPESIKPTNSALDTNCLALSIVKHRA